MLSAVLSAGLAALAATGVTARVMRHGRADAPVSAPALTAGLAAMAGKDSAGWQQAIDEIAEGVAILTGDLYFLANNRCFRELMGITAIEAVPGRALRDVLHQAADRGVFAAAGAPQEIDSFVAGWMDFFKAGKAGQQALQRCDRRWLLVNLQPRRDGGSIITVSDITAQKTREEELQQAQLRAETRAHDLERHIGEVEEARNRVETQAADYVGLMEELAIAQGETQQAHAALLLKEEQLRRMTDNLPVLVADIDAQGVYRYCNGRYLDFFNLQLVDVIGHHVSQVFGADYYEQLRPDLEAVLTGTEVSFRRALNSHGDMRQLEGKYIPQLDANGIVGGFYVAAWDVTEQHRREAELNREVTTDALTGLLNRRALHEVLAGFARELSVREQSAELPGDIAAAGAVMFLDIDHFKQINDTLGHAAGDQLLKIFAQRLRGAVRKRDHVARLGGDEFVVLLTDVGAPANAEKVAQKILDRMAEPVGLDDRMINIGTSIGIAHSQGEVVTPDFLLQEADAALYEAKKAGRGTYRLRQIKAVVAVA